MTTVTRRAGAMLTLAGLALTGLSGQAQARPVSGGRKIAPATSGGPVRSGWARQVAIGSPRGVVVTGGRLYITGRVFVREVSVRTDWLKTPAGNGTELFTGDGGPAAKAGLTVPGTISVDSSGNLAIVDSGRVRMIALRSGTFFGQKMTAGDIYTVAGDGKTGFSGDGGPATRAGLNPQGLTTDPDGNLIVTDFENSRMRVVAARTGMFYGQPMTAGRIYTVAGNGTNADTGDGGPAISAEVSFPWAVATDKAGDVMIADNQEVRMVAASTGTFFGQPMTAGDIYRIAGGNGYGFAGDAVLTTVAGLAVDSAGNLAIADTDNSRIRMVAARTGTSYGRKMITGDIYTIAGNGKLGFSGDGGPASKAALKYPGALAFDGAGNLVISDGSNHRVRMMAVRSESRYGLKMTAGRIYTVAGNGWYKRPNIIPQAATGQATARRTISPRMG